MEKVDRFTVGYRANRNGTLHIAELPEQNRFLNTPTIIRGGGSLLSTTNDYSNFCKMLLNNGSLFDKQILKPETVALMTKDHLVLLLKFQDNHRGKMVFV